MTTHQDMNGQKLFNVEANSDLNYNKNSLAKPMHYCASYDKQLAIRMTFFDLTN
jgi:hypothetical protein